MSNTIPPAEPARHGIAEVFALVDRLRRIAYDKSLTPDDAMRAIRDELASTTAGSHATSDQPVGATGDDGGPRPPCRTILRQGTGVAAFPRVGRSGSGPGRTAGAAEPAALPACDSLPGQTRRRYGAHKPRACTLTRR